jgi:hypothetical protein
MQHPGDWRSTTTRYDNLVNRLRTAVQDPSELSDGYSYLLDSDKISLPEISEWIGMERLCCPFLTFNLEVAGETSRLLTMRGQTAQKQ